MLLHIDSALITRKYIRIHLKGDHCTADGTPPQNSFRELVKLSKLEGLQADTCQTAG